MTFYALPYRLLECLREIEVCLNNQIDSRAKTLQNIKILCSKSEKILEYYKSVIPSDIYIKFQHMIEEYRKNYDNLIKESAISLLEMNSHDTSLFDSLVITSWSMTKNYVPKFFAKFTDFYSGYSPEEFLLGKINKDFWHSSNPS